MSIERRDFLVEVGTEELPPTALRGLELAFASGVGEGLDKAGLQRGTLSSFSTPRRLAVLVKRVAVRQPEQNIRRRGPPVSAAFDAQGQPTRAALAFAESCGVAVAALEKQEEVKGTFLYFVGTKPGAESSQLLPEVVRNALEALPIPRRMRWGSGDAEFVRPVHWLVMLHGREVVQACLLDVQSGSETRGHRFHAPKPLRVAAPASYERVLQTRGHVVADFAKRRDSIRQGIEAAAATLGGRALLTEKLLEEVTALVEWPVALAGGFEARFLQLPREVLISTLQEHQRYFPVEDAAGRLLPSFITVSNIESRDPAKVREGNERVVRPRLADAAFFWDQDRSHPLASRGAALDSMTYQARLGSLGDKSRRVRALAGEIAASLQFERASAERAAELCKCDLLTAMVGEFPDLQGIMGEHYALADGESADVAAAIREHYLPRSAGDNLPRTRAGVTLAIADKLDTLAGIFAIDAKPTGTKDPFGLRRAAIGLLRILIEERLELDMRAFIGRAVQLVRSDLERHRSAVSDTKGSESARSQPKGGPEAPVEEQIHDFIMERLRAHYLDRNTSPAAATPAAAVPLTTEMFDAVLASKPASLLDFDARLRALSAFLELPEASALTAANKRTANILRQAHATGGGDVDVESLREAAEVRLFDAMRSLHEPVARAVAQREYSNALGRLAQLRPPIDAFFDQVMVMDKDPKLRSNRLALLAQLHGLFSGIADLSRLPG